MKPFVLIATLRTPIALSRPLHLDGLLLAAAFRLDPSQHASLDGLIASRDGIPQASAGFLIYDGFGAPVQPVTRLRALRLSMPMADKIHATKSMPAAMKQVDAMSPYRNQITPHKPLASVRAVAWQALGDAERVLELAQTIDNLGAMHGQGFGEVTSWHIEECATENDRAGWAGPNRLLRRLPKDTAASLFPVLPAGVLEDTAPAFPPYWSKADEVPILEPTLASLVLQEGAARDALGY